MIYSPGWTYKSTSVTSAQAFEQFRSEKVDLEPVDVDKARRSRDYLKDQLVRINNGDSSFPRLTGEFMAYGSFARKTKVRPLDDLDMLVMLQGQSTLVQQASWDAYTYLVGTSHRLNWHL